MQHEEIKVLLNDFASHVEEESIGVIDSDTLIEILWKKKQRVQCLA